MFARKTLILGLIFTVSLLTNAAIMFALAPSAAHAAMGHAEQIHNVSVSQNGCELQTCTQTHDVCLDHCYKEDAPKKQTQVIISKTLVEIFANIPAGGVVNPRRDAINRVSTDIVRPPAALKHLRTVIKRE